MGKDEPVSTTAAVQEMETTGATTEPTVPCLQMGMLNAAVAELNAEGQQFLLHIKAFPENTTDKIVYTSADESIATVTEDGKITAVSEGETKIYISCGKVSMDCPVIVKYVEETVSPITEETVPEETELSATEPEAAEPNETNPDESASTEEVEEEPADNQANAALKNVTLKLKKKDIQLGVYYQFQLVLDCDLDPEEVTWSSEHPHIATVDEQGNVTAVKEGTTSISAKYGDQEVQCIVRCVWY
ncbi:MAG: Ig-like domain-containing protein, partial [Firmicutes bacterium]|nr:Ig-like domain-containing protein [Bacillota bacterium]